MMRNPHSLAVAIVLSSALASSVGAQSPDRSRDFGAAGGWQTVRPLPAPTGGAAWPPSIPSTGNPSFDSPPPLLSSTQSGNVPSWNAQPNAWRMGVAIENTETGVVLTEVEPGMPAQRAGLAVGDALVNVGGYQIGYMNGTLFDLGDELQRRADPQGRVSILVFDQRNRRLRQTPLQLAQQGASGIRGEIACRERITLSPQAALTVRMRDVTYANWQNVEVGKQVIPNPSHPPIPFSIQVDPTSLYPDHRYAVDAWLEDRGQIVLQSDGPVPVDPRGGSVTKTITLVRTGASVPQNNTYAVGQLQQIAQWYRQYLGREAAPQELASWQSSLQAGQSPQDILAYILGGSEFYDRQGNQRDRYLSALYTALNGRAPTSADLQQWADRYTQYGGARSQFVRDAIRFLPATSIQ